MAWLKVDDGFWSHPKTATLSDAAVTLWVRAGSYSCQHLTDGAIKRSVLRLLGTEDAAVELVDAGLWIPEDDGWSFHDWDEYQETSETVKKRRADARDRQRRAREAREMKQAESRRESRVTDSVSNGVSSLPPTRPDPTPSSKEDEGTAKRGGVRGTRVPDTFEITPDMREWAAENVPLVDVDKKLGEWLDYWRSVPGQKGVKLDWVSTWRNGMRKQQQFAERDAPTAGAGDPNAWMNRSTW